MWRTMMIGYQATKHGKIEYDYSWGVAIICWN